MKLIHYTTAALALSLAATTHAGLVGFWSFDGDADADFGGWGASTQRNGGNASNDIGYDADVPTEISGRASTSISFAAGADDNILTGFNAGTAGIAGGSAAEFSISFWLKRGTSAYGNSNNDNFLYLGDATAAGGAVASFEVTSNNRLASYYFNGNRVSGNNQLGTDTWQHWVLTYSTNHGTSKLYVDGVLDNTSTVASSTNAVVLPNGASIAIGNRVTEDNQGEDFKLAELAIYDNVLTQGEITALAAGSNPVPEPSSLALLGLGGLLIARRRRN